MSTPQTTVEPWGLPPDFAQIPDALRKHARWVVWVAIPKPDKPGEFEKVPRQAVRPDRGASTNNASHWGTFEQACSAYNDNGFLSGVGYVLTAAEGVPDSGIFAIDIDKCPSVDDERVQTLRTLGTYIEQSPSGRGYRLFGVGVLPGPAYSNHDSGVEFYDKTSPRYVTVTGRQLTNTQGVRVVREPSLKLFYDLHRTRAKAATTVDATLPQIIYDAHTLGELVTAAHAIMPLRCHPFWIDGDPGAFPSGSEACQAIFVHLLSAGWELQDVYAVGELQPSIMQRYLNARQGDGGRARQLLWEDVQRAEAFALDSPAAVATSPDAFPELPLDGPDVKPKQRLLVDAADMDNPPPPDWLVKGYIERGTLAILFGEPATGKSFVAIDIAQHIARGVDWNGRRVKQGGVVYVAGEGHKGIARRMKAASLAGEFELRTLPLKVSRVAVPMLDSAKVKELLNELVDLFNTEHWTTKLVVIDTMRRNFGPGDENSTEDMGKFIEACALIATVTGAAVLVVHHSGHGDRGRERGSSVITGDFDARYQLTKDGHTTTLTPVKLKDALLPPVLAFSLETVSLGQQDEDGDEITSAVPRWAADTPPDATGGRVRGETPLKRSSRTALEVLDRLLRVEHLPAPQDARLLGARFVVSLPAWREEALAAGIDRTDDRASARRTWNRAKAELISRGYVLATDDDAMVWLTDDGLAALGNGLYL